MKKMTCYVLALAGVLCGCRQPESTANIPAVKNFDVARYEGRWYEIARLPHWFERDVTDAQAQYTLQADGVVQVINSGQQYGKAKISQGLAELQTPGVGLFTVSFGWPARGVYKIIWLDEKYQTALVTADTKACLWILSREKTMPPAELLEALARLQTWGYEVKLLQYPNGQMLANPQRR